MVTLQFSGHWNLSYLNMLLPQNLFEVKTENRSFSPVLLLSIFLCLQVHCCRPSATELFRLPLSTVSGTNYHATSHLHRHRPCEFSAVVCRLIFSTSPSRLFCVVPVKRIRVRVGCIRAAPVLDQFPLTRRPSVRPSGRPTGAGETSVGRPTGAGETRPSSAVGRRRVGIVGPLV